MDSMDNAFMKIKKTGFSYHRIHSLNHLIIGAFSAVILELLYARNE